MHTTLIVIRQNRMFVMERTGHNYISVENVDQINLCLQPTFHSADLLSAFQNRRGLDKPHRLNRTHNSYRNKGNF